MKKMSITSNVHSQFMSSLHFPSTSNPTFTFFNCTSKNCTNQPSPPKNPNIEIRVCTNRTCRRQGSLQIYETLLGISPPHVSVNSCGCLGRCGSGPNVVVLPPAAMISHCGTTARAADLMVHVCGDADIADAGGLAKRSLDFLAFSNRAEAEFQRQDFSEAEILFSQAIEAKPIGGIHTAHKGRSAVRLATGNFSGALDDVREALVYAPQYAEAHICHGDILLAMNQLKAAEEAYAMALDISPSLRRSKSFNTRIQMLQEKMTSTTIS